LSGCAAATKLKSSVAVIGGAEIRMTALAAQEPWLEYNIESSEMKYYISMARRIGRENSETSKSKMKIKKKKKLEDLPVSACSNKTYSHN
jgi:hypothetical protein